MNTKEISRAGLAALACFSLAGCFGSNGTAVGGPGGGGGGGGTPSVADYDNALSRVQNLGPQTVRQSGTVNYAGQTRLETTDPGQSTPSGFLIGDLELAADFDAGTLSGTATNFAGEVDGNAVTIDGTLSTANTSDPNVVTQTDVALPTGGTITQGGLIGSLRGDLTETTNNNTSTAQLNLTGNFSGANADGASGAAVLLLGDEDAVGFGIAGGGTFYLDRQ